MIYFRPFIASPFMPIPSQKPSDKFEPRTKSLKHEQPPKSPGKYGAMLLKRPSGGAAEKKPSVRIAEADEGEAEHDLLKRCSSSSSGGSSSDDSSESSSYTKFSDLTRRQWATIGMLAVANLCSTVAFSCIAPFYPQEAQMKGMNSTEIGIIFGVFELVMFITAPPLGKYVSALTMICFKVFELFIVMLFPDGHDRIQKNVYRRTLHYWNHSDSVWILEFPAEGTHLFLDLVSYPLY